MRDNGKKAADRELKMRCGYTEMTEACLRCCLACDSECIIDSSDLIF
jgi:hypothetical protein